MSSPSAGSPAAIPPGWYADYADARQLRWWDGTRWTDHVAPAATAVAGAAPLQPYGVEATTAPPGTRTGTVWIWLLVLLPVLGIISVFTVDWTGVMRQILETSYSSQTDPSAGLRGQFAVYSSPAYLFATILGWVTYGVSVVLAALDRRELARRGVPRPFHWAWSFLSSGVYVIGRSVVVRRRTGGGLAPLWVWIALLVLSFVASGWIIAQMFAVIGQLYRY